MKKRQVNPTEPCRRCGKPVENPKYGKGTVPSPQGLVSLKQFALCGDCWELHDENHKRFWERGWGY